MTYILLIPALAYAAVILFLRRGLCRVDKDGALLSVDLSAGDDDVLLSQNLSSQNLSAQSSTQSTAKFSVVIAARNEERNIAACLQTVFAQDISQDQYEVIVVDDRSTDNTPKILHELSDIHRNLKIITIYKTPQNSAPKKHAVTVGINAASNDIIVFTDADCRVPQTWLSTIKKYFDDGADLVQGITSYNYTDGMNKMFFGLQSIDFLSHGIVAAAAIGADMPINSNANNFAFRKKIFDEIGGYGDGGSVSFGDDDLILQRVWVNEKESRVNVCRDNNNDDDSSRGNRHNKNPRARKIRFMTDECSMVETAPTETVRGVIEQRSRWSSATVHYGTRQIALLSTVFIFYLSIAASAVLSIIDHAYLPIFAALVITKIFGELILLIPGTRIFHKKTLRKYIIPASIIQLPLVLFAVLAGVFGKLKWKDQTMPHRINDNRASRLRTQQREQHDVAQR